MSFEHTVLITAAGGNIGSALVPHLLSTGKAKLILPTSSASRIQSQLPTTASAPNVAIEEGSIKDPFWVQSILSKHQVSTVFLCINGTDELLTSLNFFDAMQRAGCVKHLVFLSACGDFVSEKGVERVFRITNCMHVLVKSSLETKLRFGEFGWKTTVLGPTLFFTNDLRSKKAMLKEGLFDEPHGEAGVSRVSLADIALAAATVILNPEHKHVGKKIQLGSLKTYKGAETTAMWSKAIGKDIRMLPCDDEGLGELEARWRNYGLGNEWVRDVRLMYEVFGHFEFGMSKGDYKVQCEVLGKEPDDYDSWVMETGKQWQSESSESGHAAMEKYREMHAAK
jgi:nucleoside-diphosphate-sugar epimerase